MSQKPQFDKRLRRPGFSMFEVLVAMVVCVSGIALIVGIIQTADNLSKRTQTSLMQQRLCQNLMNQILLGIVEPREIQREDCPENGEFWFSVKVDRYPYLPMHRIEVAVWPKGSELPVPRTPLARSRGVSASTETKSSSPESETKKFVLVSLLPISASEFKRKLPAAEGQTGNEESAAVRRNDTAVPPTKSGGRTQ